MVQLRERKPAVPVSSSKAASSSDSGSSSDGAVGRKRRARQKENPKNKRQSTENHNEEVAVTHTAKRGVVSELLNAVKDRDSVLSVVCGEVLERYAVAKHEAIAELVSLVVAATGCTEGFAVSDVAEEDDDKIEAIMDRLQKGFTAANPALFKRSFTALAPRFSEFWVELVKAIAASEYMFDGILLDTVAAWITVLSTQKVRNFRHVATVAGLAVIEALIGIASSLSAEQESSEAQLENSRKRRESRASLGNLETLINGLKTQIANLEEQMTSLFQGVFQHRYRDQAPEIRTVCIRALSRWIANHPVMFLDDNYLKFIGWTLSDREAEPRTACLEGLAVLYSNQSFLPGLKNFTSKFSQRLKSMVADVNPTTAAKAVELCGVLIEQRIIEDRDRGSIILRVCDADADVRAAAGSVIVSIVKNQRTAPKRGAGSGTRSAGEDSEVLRIAQIAVEINAKKPDEVDAAYAIVQNCSDELPSLADVAEIVQLLRADDVHQGSASTARVLAQFVLYGLMHAEQGPANKTKAKRVEKARDALMRELPLLLQLYGTEPAVLESLIGTVTLLDPAAYANSRNKQGFMALVKALESTFFTSSDEGLIRATANALGHFAFGEAHQFQKEAADVCHSLAATLATGLQDAVAASEFDDEQMGNVQIAVSRLDAIASVLGPAVAQTRVDEDVVALIKAQTEADAKDRDIAFVNLLFSAGTKLDFALVEQLDLDRPEKRMLTRIRTLFTELLDAALTIGFGTVALDLVRLHNRNMAGSKIGAIALDAESPQFDKLVDLVLDNPEDSELAKALSTAIAHGAVPRSYAARAVLQRLGDAQLRPVLIKDYEMIRMQQESSAPELELQALTDQSVSQKHIKEIVKALATVFEDSAASQESVRRLLSGCVKHALNRGKQSVAFLDTVLPLLNKIDPGVADSLLAEIDSAIAGQRIDRNDSKWTPLVTFVTKLQSRLPASYARGQASAAARPAAVGAQPMAVDVA